MYWAIYFQLGQITIHLLCSVVVLCINALIHLVEKQTRKTKLTTKRVVGLTTKNKYGSLVRAVKRSKLRFMSEFYHHSPLCISCYMMCCQDICTIGWIPSHRSISLYSRTVKKNTIKKQKPRRSGLILGQQGLLEINALKMYLKQYKEMRLLHPSNTLHVTDVFPRLSM